MNIVLAGIIFSLLSCSFSLARAEAVPLSFRQFTEKVMAYYPKLKAAHSDVDMALAKQMQAKAGFWPSLQLRPRVAQTPLRRMPGQRTRSP